MKGSAFRRRLFRWSGAPLILVLAWLSGLIWFAADVPDQIDDDQTPTDAIVVLTGGSERLEAGLALLRRKMARKLFVSGVYRGVDVAELLRISRQKPDELECCIALGHTADNTAGNAIETAAWMRAENFRSLRLVTGNYHMRRSLLEFRAVMPGVRILPNPVFPDTVKQGQWWLWPGTARLIISEYTKYLAALARHVLETPEAAS